MLFAFNMLQERNAVLPPSCFCTLILGVFAMVFGVFGTENPRVGSSILSLGTNEKRRLQVLICGLFFRAPG